MSDFRDKFLLSKVYGFLVKCVMGFYGFSIVCLQKIKKMEWWRWVRPRRVGMERKRLPLYARFDFVSICPNNIFLTLLFSWVLMSMTRIKWRAEDHIIFPFWFRPRFKFSVSVAYSLDLWILLGLDEDENAMLINFLSKLRSRVATIWDVLPPTHLLELQKSRIRLLKSFI